MIYIFILLSLSGFLGDYEDARFSCSSTGLNYSSFEAIW